MIIADLKNTEGRRFPARRLTKNVVGGASPIEAENFALGVVTLDPGGGQVPWHNHPQEEIYMVLEGSGEICLGSERQEIHGGQTVYIPSNEYHQLTNTGDEPLKFVYCYGPAGDVDHWKQELKGTLPRAGEDVPPLPEGAWPQCTEPAEEFKDR